MMDISDAKRVMEAYRDNKGDDIAFSIAIIDLVSSKPEAPITIISPNPEAAPKKSSGLKTGELTKSGEPRKKPGPPAGSNITVDTAKILQLHNKGVNNNQIAKQLGISPNTVATHVAAAEILAAD